MTTTTAALAYRAADIALKPFKHGLDAYAAGWVPILTTIFCVGIFAGGGFGAVYCFWVDRKPILGVFSVFLAAVACVAIVEFGDIMDMVQHSSEDAGSHPLPSKGVFHQKQRV